MRSFFFTLRPCGIIPLVNSGHLKHDFLKKIICFGPKLIWSPTFIQLHQLGLFSRDSSFKWVRLWPKNSIHFMKQARYPYFFTSQDGLIVYIIFSLYKLGSLTHFFYCYMNDWTYDPFVSSNLWSICFLNESRPTAHIISLIPSCYYCFFFFGSYLHLSHKTTLLSKLKYTKKKNF